MLYIIANRMKERLNKELSELQAGFRPGRGSRNQILNLKMIIEKNRERNNDLFLCLIDYKKAFDTVDQGVLWSNMLAMGLPKQIVELTMQLYSSQRAVVRTAHGFREQQ